MSVAETVVDRAKRLSSSAGRMRRRVTRRIESVLDKVPGPSGGRDDRDTDAAEADDTTSSSTASGDADVRDPDGLEDLVARAETARRCADRLEAESSDRAADAGREADRLADEARRAAEASAADARSLANEALERARRLAGDALRRVERLDRIRRLDASGETGRDASGAGRSDGVEPDGDEQDDLSSLTKDELYVRAQERDVAGRSTMTKDELIRALDE